MNEMIYMIGQGFGVLGVVLGFLSMQMKTREKLLLLHFALTACFAIHYGLIGAWSGMALNIIATIRNLIYYFVGKRGEVKKGWGILFAVVMGAVGILSWQNWYSVFLVVALTLNSYAMSFTHPQSIRKSILVTCPMALIYNILVISVGGIVLESVNIVSAAVGIIRYRKK